MRKAFAGLGLAVVLALTASGSQAAVNASVPCSGAGGGSSGLIAAIQTANAQGGGTINLAAACTYTLTSGPFRYGQGQVGLPRIASGITIEGNGATIARGQGTPTFRLMEVRGSASAALTIDDLTLRRGVAGQSGPAIIGGGAILVMRFGKLTVTNSALSGNKSANGGAISSAGAHVTVTDSRLRNNSGTEDVGGTGGAITNDSGVLIVRNSRLTGNQATAKGGAIDMPAGRTTVIESTISGNTVLLGADGGGGGIFNFGQLTIRRSTISGNRILGFGSQGGGIANFQQGDLTVETSTISGNMAGDPDLSGAAGGGIVNYGSGTVTASTIAGNRAIGPDAQGGGIADFAPLTATASIVANNPGTDCMGNVTDGGYNLQNGADCGFADHAVNANPRLFGLANNGGATETRALSPTSPALDQIPPANPACGGTVDQRGVRRPQGPACDIGAFELVP